MWFMCRMIMLHNLYTLNTNVHVNPIYYPMYSTVTVTKHTEFTTSNMSVTISIKSKFLRGAYY